MFFDFTEATVLLSDISETSPYRITTQAGCEDLMRSIGRAGLIHPPILTAAKEVVCGFRRIAAVKALGWKTVPVLFLSPDTNGLDRAMLAISENASERALNLIETSRAVALLEPHFSDPRELAAMARDLGIPGGASLYGKIAFLSRLPEAVQEGVLSGDITLPSATLLGAMPEGDMLALAGLLNTLKLNLNKQRELIGIVKEIAVIEDKTVGGVIHCPEINAILENGETDRPRKAALVRSFLKKRRFPAITQAEEAFEHLKNSLALGDRASLTPPPGFEGTRYTLTLSFSTPAELEQHRDMLSNLSRDEGLNSLLESR